VSKEFSENIGYLLHHLSCKMDKTAHKFIEQEYNISFHQFLVLMHIQEQPEINQKQIATFMTYTEAAISRQISSLEVLELIQVSKNSKNKREKLLALTVQGEKLINSCLKLLTKKSNQLMSVLTPAEESSFRATLNKLLITI